MLPQVAAAPRVRGPRRGLPSGPLVAAGVRRADEVVLGGGNLHLSLILEEQVRRRPDRRERPPREIGAEDVVRRRVRRGAPRQADVRGILGREPEARAHRAGGGWVRASFAATYTVFESVT